MCRIGADTYGSRVPVLRTRIVLAACALIAVAGLVAVALPDNKAPRATVGTEDDPSLDDDRDTADLAPGTPAEESGDHDADAGAAEVMAGAPPRGATTTTTAAPRAAAGAPTTAPSGEQVSPPANGSPADAPSPTLLHRLAYSVLVGTGRDTTSEIWSVREDGTDRRRELPTCSYGPHLGDAFDVAPDGLAVARVCGDTGTSGGSSVSPDFGVAVQDLATGATTTVVNLSVWDSASARFSPDGRRLAVTAGGRLLVVDLDDLEQHDLTPSPSTNLSGLTWSPDGTNLMTNELRIIDLTTGLVTDRSDLFEPLPDGWMSSSQSATWGPDGLVYLWSSYSFDLFAGTHRVHRADLATGARGLVREQLGYLWFEGVLDGGRVLLRDPERAIIVGPAGQDVASFPIDWRTPLVAPRPARECGGLLTDLGTSLLEVLAPCPSPSGGLPTTG